MDDNELIEIIKRELLKRCIKLCDKYECGINIAGVAFIECAVDLLSDSLTDIQKMDIIVKHLSMYTMTKEDKTAPEVVKHLLGLVKK